MCGRVIQSSGPRRYAIVDGMNVRNSRVHKHPPRWNAAPSHVPISALMTFSMGGRRFSSARGRRDARRLWARHLEARKKTALTLDHSARLGRERALRADPWSIIDSVAAEIILHGKSADER